MKITKNKKLITMEITEQEKINIELYRTMTDEEKAEIDFWIINKLNVKEKSKREKIIRSGSS